MNCNFFEYMYKENDENSETMNGSMVTDPLIEVITWG